MRPLQILTIAISAVAVSGSPAFCDGTAIILNEFLSPNEIGPVADPDLEKTWPGLADVLKRHDMDVIRPEVKTTPEMSDALVELRPELDSEVPLVIVAKATLIQDAPSSWLFFGPGTEIFDNQLADNALNALIIADIAREHEAPVVLIIATDAADANVENLFADPAKNMPEKLTYAVMKPEFVPEFLDKGVLREGAPLASLDEALPLNGFIAGAQPGDVSFSGNVSPEVVSALAYDKGIWSAFSAINKPDAVEQYLKLQPEGAHVVEARERLYMLQYNAEGIAAADEEALELTEDQRFQIQDSLDYLGFFGGVIDGKWAADTREAIRNWQLWSKFPASGYVNADQLAALRKQVETQEEKDRQYLLDEEREEREYWLATGQRGSEQELNAYLTRYPSGIFADIAYQRLEILADAVSAQGGVSKPRRTLPDNMTPPPAKSASKKSDKPAAKSKTAEATSPKSKSKPAAPTQAANAAGAEEGELKSTFLQRVFWQKDPDELEERVAREQARAEAAAAGRSLPPAVKPVARSTTNAPKPRRAAQPVAAAEPQRVEQPKKAAQQPVARAEQPKASLNAAKPSEPAAPSLAKRIQGFFSSDSPSAETAKPAPKAKPQPKTQAKADPKPAAVPKPQAKPPAPKAQPKPAAQPVPKPQPKPVVKPAAKTAAKAPPANADPIFIINPPDVETGVQKLRNKSLDKR